MHGVNGIVWENYKKCRRVEWSQKKRKWRSSSQKPAAPDIDGLNLPTQKDIILPNWLFCCTFNITMSQMIQLNYKKSIFFQEFNRLSLS